MRLFFTICIFFMVVGCSEPEEINKIINYKIINETKNQNLSKVSIDVRLSNKASKEELSILANSLRKDRNSFRNLWIAYYLPDMEVGYDAWATTHFTPNLEVKILGFTTEEEVKMMSSVKDELRDVIGVWMDDRPYIGATITIYRENQKLYLESKYKDGSGSTQEMTESELTGGTKLVEEGGNPHGEYFLLDKKGALQAGGNNGIFLEYKKLK